MPDALTRSETAATKRSSVLTPLLQHQENPLRDCNQRRERDGIDWLLWSNQIIVKSSKKSAENGLHHI